MIFMTTIFIGMISFNSVLPIASEERASYYREQTYNTFWDFVGSTLPEIPYVAVSTLLFTTVFFFMVGFSGFSRFLLYWLNTALHVLLQTYFGQLTSIALPSVEVAVVNGILFNLIFILFAGFNPPADIIPAGYKWPYQITPQHYTMSILSSIMFGDCSEPVAR